MAKDLTTSNVHRKNILNNKYALQEIEHELGFPGVLFEGSLRYTRRQVATFYDIDERTISRYIEQHDKELRDNGYEVLSGIKLRAFKDAYTQYVSYEDDGKDTDVPTSDEAIKKFKQYAIRKDLLCVVNGYTLKIRETNN